MPRSKEGIKRTKVSIDELSRAVNAVVKEIVSVPAAAKEFNVSRTTLQNNLRKKDPDRDFEYQNNSDVWRVFTREQETMLTNYLVTSSKMLYGLSRTETKKLAYNFAKVNQIKFSDSWETDRQAGKTCVTDRPVETQTTQISPSQQTNSSIPSTSTQSPVFQSPEQLPPFPKAGMRIGVAKGRCKTGKSRVLTLPKNEKLRKSAHRGWPNRKKRTRNITKKIIPESSSSSEEDNLEFGSSSSDDADWPPQDHTHEDDKENELIIKGDFWLTKLEGKKKIHYYIAEIIEVSNEEPTII
ncbi:hypothetical protein JTB14_010372 [Gonioctena quinquepunctata]|nr:hypothetical protein JTB14_010372 [Gonioctena quinquepunctata]